MPTEMIKNKKINFIFTSFFSIQNVHVSHVHDKVNIDNLIPLWIKGGM
jgi:hypothetical protein